MPPEGQHRMLRTYRWCGWALIVINFVALRPWYALALCFVQFALVAASPTVQE